MLPTLGMGNPAQSPNTNLNNSVRFRYNYVTKQYYLYGWIFDKDVIIANDTMPKSRIGEYSKAQYRSYIASFDSVGTHLWHHKANYNFIYGLDFDNNNNSIINALTTAFADVVYDSITLSIPHNYNFGNFFIFKISPGGIVSNTYRAINADTSYVKTLKYNQGEIALEGVINIHNAITPTVNNILLIRLDTTLTGAYKEYSAWYNNPSAGVSAQANSDIRVITTDNLGNYIVGGAVGTAFALSPTVSIANSGMRSLSDFFIAKYATCNCDGTSIENPADISTVNVQEIQVYPNPAKDELYINFPNYEILESVKAIEIFNIAGQQTLSINGKYGKAINISSLPVGAYLIKYGAYHGKFIKY
jgi:hypothetical protein